MRALRPSHPSTQPVFSFGRFVRASESCIQISDSRDRAGWPDKRVPWRIRTISRPGPHAAVSKQLRIPSLTPSQTDPGDSPFPRPRVYHQPGTVDERPIDAAASLDEPHHRVAIDGIHEWGLALLDSSLDGRARQIETELFAARKQIHWPIVGIKRSRDGRQLARGCRKILQRRF